MSIEKIDENTLKKTTETTISKDALLSRKRMLESEINRAQEELARVNEMLAIMDK